MRCRGAQCRAPGQAVDSGLAALTAPAPSRLKGRHLQTSHLPVVARRHIRHGQANAGSCLPILPVRRLLRSQQPLAAWGSACRCLGTQSNLPTLLLPFRLAPCPLGRMHMVHGRGMTKPSHMRVDRQPPTPTLLCTSTTTGEQQQSTALPFCLPCPECLCGTGKLDIAAGPAASAPACLDFLVPRHFSHRGPPVHNLITARRHQTSIRPPSRHKIRPSDDAHISRLGPARPRIRAPGKHPSLSESFFFFFLVLLFSFLILLGWN